MANVNGGMIKEPSVSPKFLIYALVDPIDEEVRYIGKSHNGVKRPREHMYPSQLREKTYKVAWIKSLLNLGLKPLIKVLDWKETSEGLHNLEQQYISQYKAMGARLTNATDGGLGRCGLDHTLETKRKMSRSRGGADPELEKKICDMYISGISTAEIHKQLGVPRNSAWKVIKRNGIQTRDRMEIISFPKEKVNAIFELMRNGNSNKKIREILGISKNSVLKYRKMFKEGLADA